MYDLERIEHTQYEMGEGSDNTQRRISLAARRRLPFLVEKGVYGGNSFYSRLTSDPTESFVPKLACMQKIKVHGDLMRELPASGIGGALGGV